MKQNYKGVKDWSAIDVGSPFDVDHPLVKNKGAWYLFPQNGIWNDSLGVVLPTNPIVMKFPTRFRTLPNGMPGLDTSSNGTSGTGGYTVNGNMYTTSPKAVLSTTSGFTFGCTVYPYGVPSGKASYAGQTHGLNGVYPSPNILNYGYNTQDNAHYAFTWNNYSTLEYQQLNASITAGQMVRLVTVFNYPAFTVTTYVNGVLDSTGGYSGLMVIGSGTGAAMFAGSPFNTSNGNAIVGDFWFSQNNLWTPQLVWLDYIQHLNGYRSPDSPIRFISTKSYFLPSSGLTGSFFAYEQPDTLSSGVSVAVAATAVMTEMPDTAGSSASVLIAATASMTESSDTISSSVSVIVSGSANLNESPDSLSSSAGVIIACSGIINDHPDSVSSSGSVTVSASGNLWEYPDTLYGVGSVVVGGLMGTANIWEMPDTLIARATVSWKGSVTGTLSVRSVVSGSLSVKNAVSGNLTIQNKVTGSLSVANKVTGNLTVKPAVTGSLTLKPM